MSALFSPMWGKLADTKGRKIMLLRSSLGMALTLGAMGFVQNVYQLVILRLLQGIFSGYISNGYALIASETPKEVSGKTLGTLSTGYVSGALIGPLVGGCLSTVFSYRTTFTITGMLLLLVFILTWKSIHENFHPVKKEEALSNKEVISELKQPKMVLGLLITTLIIQASNNSIAPILGLYVKELLHGSGNVTIVAGIIAALPGIANLFSAPRLGALGDKIGTDKVLSIAMLFAMIVFIPMAFASSVVFLGFFRILIGLSDGAMIPSVQSLLAQNTNDKITGRIFSWNQSFQAAGMMIGPLIGSTISGFFDYNMVFIATSILVLFNFLLLQINRSKNTL